MSRLLSELEPVTREMAHRLIGAAAILGMELFIVHTYRSHEEQDALYAIGRSEPGPKVTNAKGGESWHNCETASGAPASRAIDVAFEEMGSQRPTWANQSAEQQERWTLLGVLGGRIGLEWGGLPAVAAAGDLGHFQFRDGMMIEETNGGAVLNEG